jgi:hypothetical protein
MCLTWCLILWIMTLGRSLPILLVTILVLVRLRLWQWIVGQPLVSQEYVLWLQKLFLLQPPIVVPGAAAAVVAAGPAVGGGAAVLAAVPFPARRVASR